MVNILFAKKMPNLDWAISSGSGKVGQKTEYFGIPTDSKDSISDVFGAIVGHLGARISPGVGQIWSPSVNSADYQGKS